ncbi:hypothetical protein LguiB_013758 [Lonicera macranthoides]
MMDDLMIYYSTLLPLEKSRRGAEENWSNGDRRITKKEKISLVLNYYVSF